MVNTVTDQHSNTLRITLRANQSLSWKGNLLFIGSVGVLLLVIAGGFFWAGATLVLPFAGLELLAITVCLYYLARKNSLQEVITFSPDSVQIEKGIDKPEQTWVCQRQWTRILVLKGGLRRGLPSIQLESMGEQVEIGSFLNHRDKIKLVNILKQAVRHYQFSH